MRPPSYADVRSSLSRQHLTPLTTRPRLQVASPRVPIMLPSTMRRRATSLRRGRSNMAKLTAESKPTCYPPEAIAPGSRQSNSLTPG
jgi:hypothetical protein